MSALIHDDRTLAAPRKRWLQILLAADAASSAATGLLFLAAAGPVAALTLLPADLLRGAGTALLPFAAFVGWLASRRPPSRAAVKAVVAVNTLWAVDSLLMLAGGWVQPNGLGLILVAGQAAVVAAVALLQGLALRSRPVA